MLPAYGRELLELRESGKRPARPVYVTNDWDAARLLKAANRFALVAQLPAEDCGGCLVAGELFFNFSMLRDLDVVVFDCCSLLGWSPTVLAQVRAAQPRSARLIEPTIDELFAESRLHIPRTVEHLLARAERQPIAT